MLDLAIVIVNYNVCDLLRDCLKSVYANTGLTFDVCVVDNASPDDSAEMVAREFPQAHLIRNTDNMGYAAANNLGLQYFGFSHQQSAISSQQHLHRAAAQRAVQVFWIERSNVLPLASCITPSAQWRQVSASVTSFPRVVAHACRQAPGEPGYGKAGIQRIDRHKWPIATWMPDAKRALGHDGSAARASYLDAIGLRRVILQND